MTLIRQRNRLLHQLPALDDVLRGSLVERSIRCGRNGCHCADGSGHPSLYLCVTFAGGRTEQISLPAALAPRARAGVATYRRFWELLEQISAINREILRRERDAMRSRRRGRGRGGGARNDGSRKRTAKRRGGESR